MKNDMTFKCTVEQNKEYAIFQAEYKGHVQTFRQWTNGLNEIKLDQGFLVASGYANITDMLEKHPEVRYQINMYCGGIVPEWISIINGEFVIKTNIQQN